MSRQIEIIRQAIIDHPDNHSYRQKGIVPLFSVSPQAKILVVGQAPARQTHELGRVWDDPSGDRLREWMGLSRQVFYETDKIAHLPMDFYYPGKAQTGDKPPRKGFADYWHPKLLELMPNLQTTILIGTYAQKHYLGRLRKKNLTETVKAYQSYLPDYFPIVHPSPLNFRWHAKNPWFEDQVVAELKKMVDSILEEV